MNVIGVDNGVSCRGVETAVNVKSEFMPFKAMFDVNIFNEGVVPGVTVMLKFELEAFTASDKVYTRLHMLATPY